MPFTDVLIENTHPVERTSWSLVTKTPNGDLYAVTNPTNSYGSFQGVQTCYIFVSHDGGLTWSLSTSFQNPALSNWQGCAVIAADSTGQVHVAFAVCGPAPASEYQYIYYFKGKDGSWGSPALVWYNGSYLGIQGFTNSIAIDGSDYPHICYLEPHQGSGNYYMAHLWYDGSWHQENVAPSAFIMQGWIGVDLSNNLHCVYRQQGSTGNFIYYSQKSFGGSWSAAIATGIDTVGINGSCPACGIDQYGTLHIRGVSTYRQRSSVGVWSGVETPGDFSFGEYGNLSIDKAGNVYLLTYDGSANTYRKKRTPGGVWSDTLIKANWQNYTFGLVHACFPSVEQLLSGWQGVSEDTFADSVYHYMAEVAAPALPPSGGHNAANLVAEKLI